MEEKEKAVSPFSENDVELLSYYNTVLLNKRCMLQADLAFAVIEANYYCTAGKRKRSWHLTQRLAMIFFVS